MAKEKIATSLTQCTSCKRDVGPEVGRIPFFCDDGDNGENTKHEPFCPQCFVYVRSLREQHRFIPGTFVPVKCAKCGNESVSVGRTDCMQCRSPNVVVLPPLPGVV